VKRNRVARGEERAGGIKNFHAKPGGGIVSLKPKSLRAWTEFKRGTNRKKVNENRIQSGSSPSTAPGSKNLKNMGRGGKTIGGRAARDNAPGREHSSARELGRWKGKKVRS